MSDSTIQRKARSQCKLYPLLKNEASHIVNNLNYSKIPQKNLNISKCKSYKYITTNKEKDL